MPNTRLLASRTRANTSLSQGSSTTLISSRLRSVPLASFGAFFALTSDPISLRNAAMRAAIWSSDIALMLSSSSPMVSARAARGFSSRSFLVPKILAMKPMTACPRRPEVDTPKARAESGRRTPVDRCVASPASRS